MEFSGLFKPKIHHHIRWSNSLIDWKPFPTAEEAMEKAKQIKKRDESYIILERDDECERCKEFRSEAILR